MTREEIRQIIIEEDSKKQSYSSRMLENTIEALKDLERYKRIAEEGILKKSVIHEIFSIFYDIKNETSKKT